MARCISPESIPHPHGNRRGMRLTVPCGRCVNCFNNRRADWTIRMLEELKVCNTAKFVTITYNDQNLIWTDPFSEIDVRGRYFEGALATLSKDELKAYLKRLKTKVDRIYERKGDDSVERAVRLPVKYYFVGEYGPKSLRPHYHGIIFNLPKNSDNILIDTWSIGTGKYVMNAVKGIPLEKKEPLGFLHIGKVTQASIHYVTKYILDALLDTNVFSDLKDSKGDWIVEKPFSLMSKGLGASYVEKNKSYHSVREVPYYTLPGNIKKRIPRYFRDKMFNEKQKERFKEESEKEMVKKEEKLREHNTNEHIEYEAHKKNVIKKVRNKKL